MFELASSLFTVNLSSNQQYYTQTTLNSKKQYCHWQMQALDGLGLITAISAPVTAAIGGVRFIWIYIIMRKKKSFLSLICIDINIFIFIIDIIKGKRQSHWKCSCHQSTIIDSSDDFWKSYCFIILIFLLFNKGG